ncbi:MAG: sigma-54-dependent Fis family transcriptional regulator [Planctomycetaceae bacterium]|nr:sigma-54-dependent Fis family transcriptional regulator [Planctomycetaceae bacterium]MCB9952554.1 sigma-54-dependent Fis family transcriptional regulator [Planctomycetaceae bacterium]
MTLPTVVVLSPDEIFCRIAAEQAHRSFDVRCVADIESVAACVRDVKPAVVALDLRNVRDGGHAGDRIVEDILLEHPEIKILVLADPDCPELLQRRAACSPIRLHCGMFTVEDMVHLIEPLLPKPLPQPAVRTTTERTRDQFGEAVFEGLTRKFETRSPQLKQMLDDLVIAAAHDVTILLIGETGSGKTYLSNLIHELSPRRKEPFLHVACGALPRELIESELFGHSKGAFTSAHADKDGKFVAAARGTVLLDEIDVLGPEQQVKLLRVIETGEFEPVGSNLTMKSQARLVVASNLELQPLVETGRFRPDLYYRLNMLKFEIPPLRRRKVDIIPLAKKFIQKFQDKHGIRVHRIEDSVLDALLSYPWPGNVRELEHVMQRAVIYCRDGILTQAQLPSHILTGHAGPTNDPSVSLTSRPAVRTIDNTLGEQVAVSEKEIIEQALFKNGFSRTKTAKELGISRVTLYNKMKKYDMIR